MGATRTKVLAEIQKSLDNAEIWSNFTKEFN